MNVACFALCCRPRTNCAYCIAAEAPELMHASWQLTDTALYKQGRNVLQCDVQKLNSCMECIVLARTLALPAIGDCCL